MKKGCWQKTDNEEAASEGLNENKENTTGKMEEEASLLQSGNTAASSYIENRKCTT